MKIAAMLVAMAGVAVAEEMPKWKLAKGDVLTFMMESTIEEPATPDLGEGTVRSVMEFEGTFTVEKIDEKGVEVRVQFRRIQGMHKIPKETIHFDQRPKGAIFALIAPNGQFSFIGDAWIPIPGTIDLRTHFRDVLPRLEAGEKKGEGQPAEQATRTIEGDKIHVEEKSAAGPSETVTRVLDAVFDREKGYLKSLEDKIETRDAEGKVLGYRKRTLKITR